jgi:hypothetical protein
MLIQGRLAEDALDVYFSYETPAKLWTALELAYGVHDAVKQDELECEWGRLSLRNLKNLWMQAEWLAPRRLHSSL